MTITVDRLKELYYGGKVNSDTGEHDVRAGERAIAREVGLPPWKVHQSNLMVARRGGYMYPGAEELLNQRDVYTVGEPSLQRAKVRGANGVPRGIIVSKRKWERIPDGVEVIIIDDRPGNITRARQAGKNVVGDFVVNHTWGGATIDVIPWLKGKKGSVLVDIDGVVGNEDKRLELLTEVLNRRVARKRRS